MISYEPGSVTPGQLSELIAAAGIAAARVPLATWRVTVVRPRSDTSLHGELRWTDPPLWRGHWALSRPAPAELAGLNCIDLGVPDLGTVGGSIRREYPPVFHLITFQFPSARYCLPASWIGELGDRLFNRGRRVEVARREWIFWPEGTRNLDAFLAHELAHGQWFEALSLIDGFKDRVYAAIADALGVPSIDRVFTELERGNEGTRAYRRALDEQLDLRIAIAEEFGVYAAHFSHESDPWQELWPVFVTNQEFAPRTTGPVSRALRPFREEIASVTHDRQNDFLYKRLNASSMAPEALGLLKAQQLDLYVIAVARSGNVDAARAALAEAHQRGVVVDEAYLKAETVMGEVLPSSYVLAGRGRENGHPAEPEPAGRSGAVGAAGSAVNAPGAIGVAGKAHPGGTCPQAHGPGAANAPGAIGVAGRAHPGGTCPEAHGPGAANASGAIGVAGRAHPGGTCPQAHGPGAATRAASRDTRRNRPRGTPPRGL